MAKKHIEIAESNKVINNLKNKFEKDLEEGFKMIRHLK